MSAVPHSAQESNSPENLLQGDATATAIRLSVLPGYSLMPHGGPTFVRCNCGTTYPSCPECTRGWLVERNGPHGRFLCHVRYPSSTGTASIALAERRL